MFTPYGLPPQALDVLVAHLEQSPDQLVDFLMRFHHGLHRRTDNRAYISAFTIATSYFLGGFVPLMPYFFVEHYEVDEAFRWSALVMAVALFAFGYLKTCAVRGWLLGRYRLDGVKAGAQMVVIGGVAAGAAMGLVKVFS